MSKIDPRLLPNDDDLPEATEAAKTGEEARKPSSEPSHTGYQMSRLEMHRQVWDIALPAVVTMLLQTVNSLVDMFFVGHLPNGKEALAATGVGGGVLFLLISVSLGVAAGTTALVARFTGAQQLEDSRMATGQSILLSVILGTVTGIAVYFGRGVLCGLLLNSEQNAAAPVLCSQFLGMALTATVPLFLINVLQSAFRGLGDTRTPLAVTVAMISVHILFNALLIYGRLGFPAMGVAGAGIAFAISQFLGMALFFVALLKISPLAESLRPEYLRFHREWAMRILRIGVPASVQNLTRVFSMMTFSGMLARTPEGAAAVAALQIGIRTEAIAFMPGFGYSVAASALVGQSLGAKRPERAERYAWAANLQAMIVMSLMAVLFFTFAHPIAAVFTQDTLVRSLGFNYLRTNAICEPFLALGMVLTGALQGAGDTVFPTGITVLSMILLRLPLAYLFIFTLNLHTQGAWWALIVTTFLGSLMTAAWFRLGKWKRITV